MYLSIDKNGSLVRTANYREGDVSDSDNKLYSVQISALLSLVKGDLIIVKTFQASGGAVTLHADGQYNFMDIHRIK